MTPPKQFGGVVYLWYIACVTARRERVRAVSSSPTKALVERTSIVLVETSEDLNIGSALRACWNMGIHDLRLVNPVRGDPERIAVTAPGLTDRAHELARYDSLHSALADGGLAVGFSARDRRARREVWDLEILGDKITEWLPTGDNRLHLVFGPEYAGLSNEDLDLCQACVQIATDSSYHSLNLAQAVLLGCYTVRRAAGLTESDTDGVPGEAGATLSDLEDLMQDTVAALQFIEFFKYPGAARHIEGTLRQIFGRARLDQREVKILRGIFNEVIGFGRRSGLGDPPE